MLPCEPAVLEDLAAVRALLVERGTRSRERLEAELRQALGQITSVAERALARANALRSQGEVAQRAELSWIAALRARVEALGWSP